MKKLFTAFSDAESQQADKYGRSTGLVRVVDDCTLRFNVGGETLPSAFLFSGILLNSLILRRVHVKRYIGPLLARRVRRHKNSMQRGDAVVVRQSDATSNSNTWSRDCTLS